MSLVDDAITIKACVYGSQTGKYTEIQDRDEGKLSSLPFSEVIFVGFRSPLSFKSTLKASVEIQRR